MIVHILRHLQERDDPAVWPLAAEPAIDGALRQIHEHPERPWTVQQLSRTAGMSRTAFGRRFRSVVGVPPIAYLSEWRLASAARLLRETTAPVATVARRVGYSTPFALSAAFRRKYGVPPGRYRELKTADAPA
jgi:AraC-like DNA-binding protein